MNTEQMHMALFICSQICDVTATKDRIVQ